MRRPDNGVLALKRALSDLDVFVTSQNRLTLLRSLQSDGIDLSPNIDGGARTCAAAFVDACLGYPHALHRLKVYIDYFEGPTYSARKSINLIDDLLPSEWFGTVSERTDYVTALAASLKSDRLDQYFLEATGKPTPTPLPDVNALVRALERLPISGDTHPLLTITMRPGEPPLQEWAETLARRMDLPISKQPPPKSHDVVPRRNRGTRILSVAPSWSSTNGGISTLNRQSCIALAAIGADVTCLVPDFTDRERTQAAEAGVRLATTPDANPEIIIGHSWITGETARDLAHRFPAARRVHVLHMAPEENEWEKKDRSDDAGDRAAARRALETGLASTAALAVAVGPRLYQRFRGDLPAATRLVRLDPGFDSTQPQPRSAPEGYPYRILVFGRTDDVFLKGLDLAAKAVGRTDRYRGERAAPIELVVRGAKPGASEKLRDELRAHADHPGVKICPRPYTSDAAEVAADLAQASLVLLPSRSDGFGMAGLEAIVAGTPLLTSAETGLGQLLNEVLPVEQALRTVVPISHDAETDADTWSRAVWAMLRDRDAAFSRAAELHRTMAEKKTWRDAVLTMLEAVGEPEKGTNV